MDKAAIDIAKALVRLSEVTIFELRGGVAAAIVRASFIITGSGSWRFAVDRSKSSHNQELLTVSRCDGRVK
jgi:hypothetical protein